MKRFLLILIFLLITSSAYATDAILAIATSGGSLSTTGELELQRGNTEISLKSKDYQSIVLGSSGIANYYTFGTGSGSLADSVSSNTLTTRYNGSGTVSIASAGKIGNGLAVTAPSYNNTGSAYQGTAVSLGTTWSIVAIIKRTHSITSEEVIAGNHDFWNSTSGLQITFASSNSVAFKVGGSGSYSYYTIGATALNTYHHIVAIYNNGTITTYFDGSPAGGGAQAYSSPGTRRIAFGAYSPDAGANANTYGFNGVIDEIAIYNTAISSDTVSSLYSAFATAYSAASPTATLVKFGGVASSTFKPSTFVNNSNLAGEAGNVKIQYCCFDSDDASDCSYNGSWLTVAQFQAVGDIANKKWCQLKYQFNSDGSQDASMADSSMVVTLPAGAAGGGARIIGSPIIQGVN